MVSNCTWNQISSEFSGTQIQGKKNHLQLDSCCKNGSYSLALPGVIIKGSLDFQLEVNQLGTGSGPASMRMRVLLLVFTQVFFNLENYHLIEEKEFH